MKRRLGFLLVLGIVLVAGACIAGGLEKAADKNKPRDDIYDKVELFADAISAIRGEYVEDVDAKKLIYGAMKGMLESLDDYSQFLDPDEFNEIKVETKGEFGGVGVEISQRDGILTIITPIVGTPAEAAGIKPGDKVVKIDGKITKDMTLNDAVKAMRGKPGSMITITVWRDGLSKITDIPIKRDIIKIKSIKRSELLDGKIGYIRLVEFQESTARDLDEAMKKLKVSGMDSLILDLRNNPGGLFEGAIDVAERFLTKDKVIVSIRSRESDKDIVFKSSGRSAHSNFPLIVIVNEGSASASEIVAGAIKDNRRGIVLGAKTYGKASVQTVIPLKDGSAVRLTTAYYLTPSGKLIKDEGIAPDVSVERVAGEAKNKVASVDIFEDLEEVEDDNITIEHADKKEQKDKAGKKVVDTDNQLDSALNLMKAIRIYKQESN